MSAPPIRRLEHWALVSSDIERTKRFYTEVLGANEPEPDGGPASLDLAGTIIHLFPEDADWAPAPGPQWQHHAYHIDLEDYDLWVTYLCAKDVPARLTTHGLNRMSIYVDDPDGYHIELTAVFPDDETARREIEKRGIEVSWFKMNPPSRPA